MHALAVVAVAAHAAPEADAQRLTAADFYGAHLPRVHALAETVASGRRSEGGPPPCRAAAALGIRAEHAALPGRRRSASAPRPVGRHAVRMPRCVPSANPCSSVGQCARSELVAQAPHDLGHRHPTGKVATTTSSFCACSPSGCTPKRCMSSS
jgi:hypothetical protein